MQGSASSGQSNQRALSCRGHLGEPKIRGAPVIKGDAEHVHPGHMGVPL